MLLTGCDGDDGEGGVDGLNGVDGTDETDSDAIWGIIALWFTLIKSSNDPDFNGVIADDNGGFYACSNREYRPGCMSRIQEA